MSVSVVLYLVGEDLDPDVVSEALGLEPSDSWKRGEQRIITRIDGSVKQLDIIHKQGGWKVRMPEKYKDEPLYMQLALWRNRLRKRREAIWSMRERGWIAELVCYVGSVEALVLPNYQMRELADLGVDLSLDIFPPMGTVTDDL